MLDHHDPNIKEALHTYRVPLAIAEWGAVAAWMGLIFYISQSSSPESIGSASKFLDIFPDWSIQWIFHGTAFGILTGLTYLAISSTFTWRWPVVVAAAFGVAMVYGAVDEVHQSFVSGRTASIEDIGRDAIGGLMAVLLTRAAVVSTDYVFHGRWVESGRVFFSVAMLLQAAFVVWVVSMWVAAGSANEYPLDALTTSDVQRSLVRQPEALLAAVPFLAVAAWIALGRCRSLYAQMKLVIAPTLSVGVVFAIPVAVFGLDVIPDDEMVWFGTWAMASGTWLFGAWLHA
jgi:hypothetical protein